MKIHELVAKRARYIEAEEENGFDLSTVLVGLYSDPSHFIYEILQNAEDAKAASIKFHLEPHKLIIDHNGRQFTENDVDAITGISNLSNQKKTQSDKIGKFGIGFKSVYTVTDSPRIQSGKFDFKILKFVLPHELTADNDFSSTTIALPFNKSGLKPNEAFGLIAEKFRNFEAFNLLFLRNLKKIKLSTSEETKVYSRKSVKKAKGVEQVSLGCNGDETSYLLFSKEVQSEEFNHLAQKPHKSLAFRFETTDEGLEIRRAESSLLFAFFETGYETFLDFLVQAPFSTTPARDNVDFSQEINHKLVDELTSLLREALFYFRKEKLLSLNLLELLPISTDIDNKKLVYKKMFQALRDEINSDEKYIPTSRKGIYQASKEVGIARGREFTKLLTKSDLESLFNIKYWVDFNLTEDKYPELHEYLSEELDLRVYGSDDFARQLDDEFLISKDNRWVRRFYEFLNGKQEYLYRKGFNSRNRGILRSKPIIRISDGAHMAPFDREGKPQVYLPVKGLEANYHTVKAKVIDSKASKEFIQEKLGVKPPGLLDRIRHHILPLYQKESPHIKVKDHLDHVKLITDSYKKLGDEKKEELQKLLSDRKLRLARSLDNKGIRQYDNCEECYLRSNRLEEFFKDTEYIKFLDRGTYRSVDYSGWLQLLKLSGYRDVPWIIEVKPDLKDTHLKQLRKKGNHGDSGITEEKGIILKDYRLEGLDEFLGDSEVTLEKSILLWDILVSLIEQDSTYFFTGTYEWFYYSDHSVEFKSQLLKKLQDTKWLHSVTGDLPLQPSEMMVSQLNNEYNISTEEAKKLIKYLRFRDEAHDQLIKQLSTEDQAGYSKFLEFQKICDEKGVDALTAMNQLLHEAQEERERKELSKAVPVDEVEPESSDYEGYDSSDATAGTRSSSSSSENDNISNSSSGSANDDHSPINQTSQKMRDEIGERGESIVFNYLKKEYQNKYTPTSEDTCTAEFNDEADNTWSLHLLNNEKEQGIGCDIIVRLNGEDSIYIEVKSSRLQEKELVPVNGYQWRTAYSMYNKGKGDSYFFYVVKDVLAKRPKIQKIQNPIQKWKDGKLKAHPINLEL